MKLFVLFVVAAVVVCCCCFFGGGGGGGLYPLNTLQCLTGISLIYIYSRKPGKNQGYGMFPDNLINMGWPMQVS